MANDLMEKSVEFSVSGENVVLNGTVVKKYLTRGNEDVADQEVVMFINLCRYQKLNPFLNEAYLVKFKGSPAQIITSKEAYMKKAESNENYDGLRAGIIVQRGDKIHELEGSFTLSDDTLLGGWAEVYRKDRKHPYKAKVGLDEYNKGQSTWKKMPKTMVRKVAIVQSLREAFPAELGALYVEEESNAVNNVENDLQDEVKKNANKKTITFDETEVKDVKYEEIKSDSDDQGPGF